MRKRCVDLEFVFNIRKSAPVLIFSDGIDERFLKLFYDSDLCFSVCGKKPDGRALPKAEILDEGEIESLKISGRKFEAVIIGNKKYLQDSVSFLSEGGKSIFVSSGKPLLFNLGILRGYRKQNAGNFHISWFYPCLHDYAWIMPLGGSINRFRDQIKRNYTAGKSALIDLIFSIFGQSGFIRFFIRSYVIQAWR